MGFLTPRVGKENGNSLISGVCVFFCQEEIFSFDVLL
jgi:hypothetical protein